MALRPRYTFDCYRDKKKDWRWRCVARNGKIVAESGEGYQRRGDLSSILTRLVKALSCAQFEVKWQQEETDKC